MGIFFKFQLRHDSEEADNVVSGSHNNNSSIRLVLAIVVIVIVIIIIQDELLQNQARSGDPGRAGHHLPQTGDILIKNHSTLIDLNSNSSISKPHKYIAL